MLMSLQTSRIMIHGWYAQPLMPSVLMLLFLVLLVLLLLVVVPLLMMG